MPTAVVCATGYSVKGTLANDLLENPSQVKALDGRPLNVKCSTTSISFSGMLCRESLPPQHVLTACDGDVLCGNSARGL